MRIGLVIYGSLATVSGGYLYDRQLVAYLAQQGDEVAIIALPWRSYGWHLLDNLSADLPRRMNGGFDVLLQDELNHSSLAWANARLRRGSHPPIVAIVHHLRASERRPAWQNWFYRRVERRYLRTADAFIYNSQTTRREVEALTGTARPHIVAYPGGDRLGPPAALSLEARANQRPFRLLFVGNVIPRKGLHDLVAALARVAGDWVLTVVGSVVVDAAYVQRVRQLAARLGLSERLIWRGGLADDDLAAEMAAAHVLAVPSAYEGFGIVYLEGLGFGLPALATTAGAAAEIITDGGNGYLVPPGDVVALAARIQSLIDDRALLARLSAAARAGYARHPTWAETTAAMRQFLVTVARHPEGG
jgi:glycosyltransferase involved in cell wall biosynthesis